MSLNIHRTLGVKQCRAIFQTFLKSTWLVKSCHWFGCCVSLRFIPWALGSPGVGSEQLAWQQSDILMRRQSARFANLLCGTAVWPSTPVGEADPWVYTAGSGSCQLCQLPITDVHAAITLAASSPLCWPYSQAQLAMDEKWNTASISEPVKRIYWVYERLACWVILS